ncbi:hypothetical protein BREVNS_1316 [Brevinematales bacterium NS]|nr:hypothetical protein BREVNS_1316 [Brevinematales bacterium NS]
MNLLKKERCHEESKDMDAGFCSVRWVYLYVLWGFTGLLFERSGEQGCW